MVNHISLSSYDGSMTAEAFTPEANCSENVNKMGFKPNQFVYTFSLTIQVPADQDYPIYLLDLVPDDNSDVTLAFDNPSTHTALGKNTFSGSKIIYTEVVPASVGESISAGGFLTKTFRYYAGNKDDLDLQK